MVALLAALPGCSSDDLANDDATVVGVAGSAGVAAGGAGTEEAPPPQGMLWLELYAPEGGSCPSTRSFEVPEGAEVDVNTTALGERVVDGVGASIECRVAPLAGAEDTFELDLELSSGSILQFRATGVIGRTAPQSVNIELATSSESLTQTGCAATARQVLPGAVWLAFSCTALVDPSAPAILCRAQSSVLFENCATE